MWHLHTTGATVTDVVHMFWDGNQGEVISNRAPHTLTGVE
jgi:hypothetical protein